jgi:hypothetical protein
MAQPSARVLVLTPVKDACRFLDRYFALLAALDYPPELLSLGMLESDSRDDTFAAIEAGAAALVGRWRRTCCWKRDFGYRIPPGVARHEGSIQLIRRAILARSRNHLLFRALDDEDWVLWLDVDVIDYPPDIVRRLLAVRRTILTPNCVFEYGGRSFDQNAWRGPGERHLSDMRDEGDLVELDAVGGTMLLVRADLHRDGLIFPSFPYGRAHPARRPHAYDIETEGLGLMAQDMGHRCWGMPNLEIRHFPY